MSLLGYQRRIFVLIDLRSLFAPRQALYELFDHAKEG